MIIIILFVNLMILFYLNSLSCQIINFKFIDSFIYYLYTNFQFVYLNLKFFNSYHKFPSFFSVVFNLNFL